MTAALLLAIAAGSLTLNEIDASIRQHNQQLDVTRRELTDARLRIAELGQREASSLARIEAYRDQSAAARRYLEQLDVQLRDRQAEIAASGARILLTSERIALRRKDLSRRLVSIYRHGRLKDIETLLSTNSLAEMARRARYLRYIARADVRLAEELDLLRTDLAAQMSRQMLARAELERLRQERGDEERRLVDSERSESALLGSIRTEREAKADLEQALVEAADNLTAMVLALEGERAALLAVGDSHEFAASKGRLPWPADGQVIATFGSRVHPTYQTKTNNRGIDISTSPGRTVSAVADGVVAYADLFAGYGKMVIVDHGGGYYTLYANLDEIHVAVGTRVGSPGDLGTTLESLHFELRKDGQPVDPLGWLRPR